MSEILTVYCKPDGEIFREGREIFMEQRDECEPLAVKSFQIGEVLGRNYLLANFPREEYVGNVTGDNGAKNYAYKSTSGVVIRDESGSVVGTSAEWIQKGVRTTEGVIVDVADNMVAVDCIGGGIKLFRKSQVRISDIAVAKRNAEEELLAYSNLMRLRKAYKPSDLTKEPPKLDLSSLQNLGSREVEGAREGEEKQFGQNDTRRLGRGSSGNALRWLDADAEQKAAFDESSKREEQKQKTITDAAKPQEAQKPEPEPETPKQKKQEKPLPEVKAGDVISCTDGDHVVNYIEDGIIHMTAEDGEHKWIHHEDLREPESPDEEQAQSQEQSPREPAQGDEGQAENGIPSEYSDGELIPSEGDMALIIDQSPNLIAVQTRSGETRIIKRDEYRYGAELLDVPRELRDAPWETQTKMKHLSDIMSERSAEAGGSSRMEEWPQKEGWQEEREAGEKQLEEIVNSQEYQALLEVLMDEGGWSQDRGNPLRYVKRDAERREAYVANYDSDNHMFRLSIATDGNERNAKECNGTFTGADGEHTIKILHIRHGDTPVNDEYMGVDENDVMHRFKRGELSNNVGEIIVADDGVVFVKKGENTVGFANGISSQELMKPGVLAVIKDTIYKAIDSGDGVVAFNELGRVEQYIAVCVEGDMVAAITADGKGIKIEAGQVIMSKQYAPGETGFGNISKRKDVQSMIKKVREARSRIEKSFRENFTFQYVRGMAERANAQLQDFLDLPASLPHDQELNLDKYSIVCDKMLNFVEEIPDISGKIIGDTDPLANQTNEIAYPILDRAWGTPAWVSSVKDLASKLAAHDVLKFNAMSEEHQKIANSGYVQRVQETPPTAEQYLDAANKILTTRLKTYQDKRRISQKLKARADEMGNRYAKETHAILPQQHIKAMSKKTVSVWDGKNNKTECIVAVVPKSQVQASNNLQGEINPRHPRELQPKEREEYRNVSQVEKIRSAINGSVTSDSNTPTSGMPMLYCAEDSDVDGGVEMMVAQGNGRTIAIQNDPNADAPGGYLENMLRYCRDNGIDTANVTKDDMLVRIMTPGHTYDDAIKLSIYGQVTGGSNLNAVESARALQQRVQLKASGLNLDALNGRPITEKNVDDFRKSNSVLFDEIMKSHPMADQDLASSPKNRADAINHGLLAMMGREFTDDIFSKGNTRSLKVVTEITPQLVANKLWQNTEAGKGSGINLEKIVGSIIGTHRSTTQGEQTAMRKNQQGTYPFLRWEGAPDENTLQWKLNQEEMGGMGSQWNDPVWTSIMISYNEAMTPQIGKSEEEIQTKEQKALGMFAFKMRRFEKALRTAEGPTADMFAGIKTDEEKKAEIGNLAEMVFLENKVPQRMAGEEYIGPESEYAAEQTSAKHGLNAGIKKYKKDSPATKSIRHFLRGLFFGKTLFQRQKEEIALLKSMPTVEAEAKKPVKQTKLRFSVSNTKPEKPIALASEDGRVGKKYYWYKGKDGQHYKGDKEGTKLARHWDWKGGDLVHWGAGKHGRIAEMADTVAMLHTQHGIIGVEIKNIMHDYEHQDKVFSEKKKKKGNDNAKA